MTNREAVQAFLDGRHGHSMSVRSDGRTLYSYAEPIATWTVDDGRNVVAVSDCYASGSRFFSVTTSHHLSAVRGQAALLGVRTRELKHDELRAAVRS